MKRYDFIVEVNFIVHTSYTLILSTACAHLLELAKHVCIVIVLPLFVCELDSLLHLSEGVFEHLCEVAAHLINSLLELSDLFVLLIDHVFFLVIKPSQILFQSLYAVLLASHMSVKLGDLLLQVLLHALVLLSHLVDH